MRAGSILERESSFENHLDTYSFRRLEEDRPTDRNWAIDDDTLSCTVEKTRSCFKRAALIATIRPAEKWARAKAR